ncbi:MAG: COG3014 family protein [Chitinophagaceae bacterium]
MFILSKRAWAVVMFLPFLFACSTYNNKINAYYGAVKSNQLEQAQIQLNSNKFLQKKRNRLLYFLEQGKLLHLQKQYAKSNLFLNAADAIIENRLKNIGNVILSNLTNPMATDYKQEDFEIFMVHYYKALNYLQLGDVNEAVVEARRIGLSNNFQKDKYRFDSKKYTQDAFSLNLQGMLYEANNEINNAFISYRNAVDLYLNNGNNYYGTTIPNQLKKDVVRTANKLGFYDIADIYKQKLGNIETIDSTTSQSELIIFFENGLAPTKQENNFVLTSGTGGSFFVTDAWGIRQNINMNGLVGNDKLSSIRTLRVAMPTYQISTLNYPSNTVIIDNKIYTPTIIENLNQLSTSLLQERWLKELTNAAVRQIAKKAVEKGTEKLSKSIAENNTKDTNKDGTKKTEEQKKKDKEKNEDIAEAMGFIVNMFNTVTEKADTRGWQTLPAFISYVRIPLNNGENNISLNSNGKTETITINAKKGLQFYNFINWQ